MDEIGAAATTAWRERTVDWRGARVNIAWLEGVERETR